MDLNNLHDWYIGYKEPSLFGRYIHLEHIIPLLAKFPTEIDSKQIGVSENDAPIHLIKLGTGGKKLLLWSQMHGNESTTTKSVFDLLNFLQDDVNETAIEILDSCTLYIVPILSPDGAKAYTRLNYNHVDLNRDAQDLTQRESKVLHELIAEIQPDYCFNLHGQRTIFGAGETQNPATVSFLSAAGDSERTITASRKVSMEIIAEMNNVLQKCIPSQVGRYDDGFNINCMGDTLEYMGIPAILFEAGHFPGDYDREVTREYIFYSLVTAINYITKNKITGSRYEEYFLIPENEKCFYDVIIRDVILRGENVDIAVQYLEKLVGNAINFVPKIVKIGDLSKFFGHKEILGNKRAICNEIVTVEIVPEIELLNFYLDSELFSI